MMLDGESNQASFKRRNFLKVKIDRISKSGNILAVSEQNNFDHIHVNRGKIGETVIAFVENGGISAARSGKKPAKILRYDTVEDALTALPTKTSFDIICGELLKVGDRTIVEDDQTKVSTPDLNVEYIIPGDLDRGREGNIMKIDSINGNVAQASVVYEGNRKTISNRKRNKKQEQKPTETPKRPWAMQSSSKQEEPDSSDDEGINNPFKESGGEYNNLL